MPRETKAARRVTKRVARGTNGHRRETKAPIHETPTGISPAAFLAALRAERSKIDAAIAAVEALA